MVQYIGAEPMICVRWTGKTPQDAADEIEYFNGNADTKWGRMRAKNGHPAPYHVKYWQIGNEIAVPDYDASLKPFGASNAPGGPLHQNPVFLSHPKYVAHGGRRTRLSESASLLRRGFKCTEEDFKRLRDEIVNDGTGKDVRVAVTEWNATGGEFGLKRGMLLTLGNAFTLSRYQNMMHRYSDLVEIANRSNLSDSFGSGAIQPGPGWLYLTPAYYSQSLYQRATGSFPLKIDRSSPLSFYLREPDLDATLSSDGRALRIYAVNSTAASRKIAFHLNPSLGSVRTAESFVLGDTSPSPDSEAMNSHDQPNRVAVTTRKVNFTGREFEYEFNPFTVTLLELRLRTTTE